MYLIKSSRDIERAQELFNDAFNDSEGINWVLKNRSNMAKELTIKVLLHEGVDKKGAYITEDRNGAVLFYGANNKGFSIRNLLRKAHLALRYAGLKNTLKLVSYRKMIDSTRPTNTMVGFLVATDRKIKANKAIYDPQPNARNSKRARKENRFRNNKAQGKTPYSLQAMMSMQK